MKKLLTLLVLALLPTAVWAAKPDKPGKTKVTGKPERVEALHEAIEVRKSAFEEAKQLEDKAARKQLHDKSREEFWGVVQELYKEDIEETEESEVQEAKPSKHPWKKNKVRDERDEDEREDDDEIEEEDADETEEDRDEDNDDIDEDDDQDEDEDDNDDEKEAEEVDEDEREDDEDESSKFIPTRSIAPSVNTTTAATTISDQTVTAVSSQAADVVVQNLNLAPEQAPEARNLLQRAFESLFRMFR